ncbi:MAG: glycosyltransferase [Flavobacteriales bacterium]|nr:glycosyltransferase [Flavobacteriales bacterium]
MKSVKKIKVLFRTGSLRGGGAEKVLIYLLKNLDYSKFEVDLLLNIKHGVYLSEIPKNVTLHYIGTGPEFVSKNPIVQNLNKIRNVFLEKLYLKFPKLLYKKINKIYDIEVGFIQEFAKILYISPLKKSKKILWIHSNVLDDLVQDSHTKDLLKKYGESLDKIVAVSKSSLDKIIELNPNLKSNSTFIYNPVDEQEIKKLANQPLEQELPRNIKNNTKLISIGTVAHHKGFDRIIKAVARLKKENIPSELYILGSPLKESYLIELKDLCTELNVENEIHFLGFKTNPYQYLKNTDIFVCSSHSEGFSLVVAEAMILKKVIVSTNIEGPNELLNYGEFGELVDNSEEGIYNGIKHILLNPKIQEEYISKLKSANNRFDGNKFIEKVTNVLIN